MDCNDLLTDWIEYCEGRGEFDRSHFYCLLMDDPPPTDAFLEAVLRYFPARAELKRRIKLVKHPNLLVENIDRGDAGHDRLRTHLRQYLLELAKVCEAAGEADIAEQMLSARMVYCDDRELVDAKSASLDEPQCELIEVVGDHLGRRSADRHARDYALSEAFYGMTSSFELCWYLNAPLRGHQYDFEPYVRFWALGGLYVWTADGILITSRKSDFGSP